MSNAETDLPLRILRVEEVAEDLARGEGRDWCLVGEFHRDQYRERARSMAAREHRKGPVSRASSEHENESRIGHQEG